MNDLLDVIGDFEVVFDGPDAACPMCAGTLHQLQLDLDAGTGNPAACAGCGAVLAAA